MGDAPLPFSDGEFDATMAAMNYGLSLAFVALWLSLCPAPAGAQDFDKGLAAARAGDFAAAITEWRPLAEDGHAEAQFNLGAIYEAGLGVSKNPKDAAGWYTRAAKQDHARAQYNLGIMFAEGRGVRQSDIRAASWLRKAATQNHAKAQYNLGVFYQSGRGVPKDLAKARDWFDRAAVNGIEPPKNAPSKSAAATTARRRVPGTPPAPPTAAPPDELLEVATVLQAGTRYRLKISESQQRTRGGVIEASVTVTADIDLLVTEANGGGAVVELVHGKPSVQTSDGSLGARFLADWFGMLEGQRIIYRTDGEGVVTGLANSNEVEALYDSMIERSLQDVGRQANNPMFVETMRAVLEPMRRGPYMEDDALEVPKLLHFFNGLKLTAQNPYSRSRVMRFRLNGAEVPSKLSYELAWFDRTNKVAWLRWVQTADRRRIADVVEAFVRDLADSVGQPLPQRFDVGSAGVFDEAIYELDLKTGLPKGVAYTRHTQMLDFELFVRREIRFIQ